MPKYRVSESKRSQARRLRRVETGAEQRLWRLLRSRRFEGIKFRRQAPIGSWIVDFVAFDRRLVVEADGSQHVESSHDHVRDTDLRNRGFKILRFWNDDSLLNENDILERITEEIEKSPSPRGLRPRPSPTRGEG